MSPTRTSPELIYRMRWMRERQGLDTSEISAILGINRGNIWQHVHDLPMIRKCKRCGGLFETYRGRQVLCGQGCRK